MKRGDLRQSRSGNPWLKFLVEDPTFPIHYLLGLKIKDQRKIGVTRLTSFYIPCAGFPIQIIADRHKHYKSSTWETLLILSPSKLAVAGPALLVQLSAGLITPR